MWRATSPEEDIRISGFVTINGGGTLPVDCDIYPEEKYNKEEILEEIAKEDLGQLLTDLGLEYLINNIKCD